MDISTEQAFDILAGWQKERRRLHFHTFDDSDAGDLSCSGLGAIEELTPQSVRIDNRSVKAIVRGDLYGCTVSLKSVLAFSLWDWRNVPPEEQPAKEALQESYDISLTMTLASGASCELHAIKFVSELPDIIDG